MENTNPNVVDNEQKYRVNLKRPAPFDPVGDIKITTTEKLSKTINTIFSKVFGDYFGCQLTVQFQPERQCYILVPMLYFRVLAKDAYDDSVAYCFKPLGSEAVGNIVGRVQLLSKSAVSGQKVDITKEGKEALEEFIINPVMKNQKFDWDSAFRTVQTEGGTYVQAFKLDINKFISKIFGAKDDAGSDLYYQITPAYVVGATNQYKKPDNWVLHILRLNHANEAAAAELLGMYMANGNDIQGVVTEMDK